MISGWVSQSLSANDAVTFTIYRLVIIHLEENRVQTQFKNKNLDPVAGAK
jgi:hypothetical protein